MTKHLRQLFLPAAAFLFATGGYAHDVEVDGIYYNLNKTEQTANVTFRGNDFTEFNNEYTGDVIIPASFTSNGVTYSVTGIGETAFFNCKSLTSVVIPEGVRSIGNYAFEYCSNMTSVVIPEGVTSIGVKTFSGCSGLTSIVIPESMTNIGAFAFENCTGLTSITIPEGVTSIENYTFRYCSGLFSIHIPEGVTSIGLLMFSNCNNLTSIHIPEGVTSIGERAFIGCSSLTSVSIPKSVNSIGFGAFARCSSLTSVYSFNPEPPMGEYETFDATHYSNATLYVLPDAMEAYQKVEPWLNFKNIQTYGQTTINDIETAGNDKGSVYYDLNGRKSATLHPGVNIVRQPEGTTRKVFVK